jgi:hypothetical protein
MRRPIDSALGVAQSIVSPTVARVDSIPWFVNNLALGDLIGVHLNDAGSYVFDEVLKWSGNCTLRVVTLAEDPGSGIQDIIDKLSIFGIEMEVAQQFDLVAVSASPTAYLVQLKQVLKQGEEQELWGYDEGCIGGPGPPE